MKHILTAVLLLLFLSACGEAPKGESRDQLAECCGPDAVNCNQTTLVTQDSTQEFILYTPKDGLNRCSVQVRVK